MMRSENQTAATPRSEQNLRLPEIRLSESNFDRLESLLQSLAVTDPSRQLLGRELERAQLCDAAELPPDVVTMHSRVKIRLGQAAFKVLTLVYPAELMARSAETPAATAEQVSVLAPIGTALLGLKGGDRIGWPTPGGLLQQIEVLELLYQPERDGPLPDGGSLAGSKLRLMPR